MLGTLTPKKLANAKPELRILHPLPRVNEISREVGRLLAQNQIPVISMCREEKSLEDIYLSLMSCDSDTNASAREQQAVQPQLSDQEQKENDDESHS